MTTTTTVAPRILIDWARTPELAVAKMLAWAILLNEAHHQPLVDRIWDRVEKMYPTVTEAVLGRRVTLAELCALVEERFGTTLTPHKLFERADKAERYNETTPYKEHVFELYLRLSGQR